jgi:hypothetical protein
MRRERKRKTRRLKRPGRKRWRRKFREMREG